MITIRVFALLLTLAAASGVPDTPREPVVDEYFGTRITDPYRWMEERNAPRFVQWLKAQDAYARERLSAIPGRDALLRRIASRTGASAVVRGVRLAGGKTFFLKREAGADALALHVRQGNEERVLFAPRKGETIDYYEPSPDGARVICGLSSGGSEESVLHVIDTATGVFAAEQIDRTPYADPAWSAGGKSFYYNRLAARGADAKPSETFLDSRVYLHVTGSSPDQDVPILGTGVAGSMPLTPSELPFIRTTPASPWLMARVYRGADVRFALYLSRGNKAGWRKVADYEDGVVDALLHGQRLYLLVRKDAPRGRIVAVQASAPDLRRARTVIAQSTRVMQGMVASSDALYVSELDGGLGKVRRVRFSGGAAVDLPLPMQGAVSGPVADPRSRPVLLAQQNWVTPPVWYSFDGKQLAPARLTAAPAADQPKFLVEEVKALARDGTPIPLSIIRRPDTKLDGSSPAWLLAYGAYGISLTPSHGGLWGTARLQPLLDDGGIYAVCHARGGGEHGEEWHRAGQGANKPNTWNDLIACAEYLIAKGYTRSSALAIEGSSAGGLAVAMAMVTRPELFRVVFDRVGDANPLRLEHGPDGPALEAEFGSTKTKSGFEVLLAADPTQHVRRGVAYPAVLLTAGFNDARVPPWQPAKLAAHLQHATTSGLPVLLRVDFEGGHTAGSRSSSDEEHADMLAFFWWQIGR